ncbi:MAG: hypothetical protein PUE23_08355, partial [Inconstantimicrobium porci]|nr:hypothetical protein [Inconstantimicrobium porci]
QYLIKTIYQLIGFIAQHIPLKQMQFDDSNSPKYQKFKVDKLPIIKHLNKLITYFYWLITSINTIRLSNPSKDVTVKLYPTKLSVLNVVQLMNTSMITMVAKASINVKSVALHFKSLILLLSL